MFDSSMVKEPSGFEPLKFYCIWIPFLSIVLRLTKSKQETNAFSSNNFLYMNRSIYKNIMN